MILIIKFNFTVRQVTCTSQTNNPNRCTRNKEVNNQGQAASTLKKPALAIKEKKQIESVKTILRQKTSLQKAS